MWSLLLALCLTLGFANGQVTGQSVTDCAQSKKVHIGVLYIKTPTGERYLKGIRQATDTATHMCLVERSYVNAQKGFEALLEMIRKEEVDVILGPTESGILVRAAELREELDTFRVPVVSGLATAKVGNEVDGWIFRTNVRASRRVQAMYDFLSKHWLSSIAVLYANTDFGRTAQLAFEKELSSRRRPHKYLALVYEEPPDPRPQLRQILNSRSEAFGYFGEREDIKRIDSLLRQMNERAMPYRPLFFTILDARWAAEQVSEIYFVSVVGADKNQIADEVQALGHDTALLVLSGLRALRVSERLTRNERQRFRDHFVAILRRSGSREGFHTGMSFDNFENTSLLHVLHKTGNAVEEVDIARTVRWDQKARHKVRVLYNSYGWWPVIAGVVFLTMALWLSWTDLRRLFRGSVRGAVWNRYFPLFTGGNFLLMSFLYLYLAETGSIRYDSIVMVLVIGLAPSALLRTTLFETPKGRAIGLEKLYQKLLSHVDEGLMKARHRAYRARENLIAYNNSETSMRQALIEIYRKHPSPAQAARMVQELDESLRNEPNYFERRRLLARRLLRRFNWDELRAEGLVPPTWDEEHPVDPQRIVRAVAKYCARDSEKCQLIQAETARQKKLLKQRNPKRFQEVTGILQAELNDAIAVEGELNVEIRFLFVLLGFDVEWFLKHNLLEDKFLEEEKGRLRPKQHWWTRVLRSVQSMFGKKHVSAPGSARS